MRRLLLVTLLLPFVSACTRSSDLSPEVVMERAILANSHTQSAHINGTMIFRDMSFLPLQMEEGTLEFEGDMQDAGKQLALSLQLQAEPSEENKGHIQIDGNVIVLDSREVYVQIEEVDVDDRSKNDSLQQLLNILKENWWSLAPALPLQKESISPDPYFLRMQSEAVHVMRDNGITSYNGRDVHLYDVELDPQKFQTFLNVPMSGSGREEEDLTTELTVPPIPEAEGSLWIDTETYLLLRARWAIKLPSGGTLALNIHFSDQQKPVIITPPAQALPLPSNANDLLNILTEEQMGFASGTIILTD